MYDQRLANWPVPFEEINIDTRYGTTHIIASGDRSMPPVFLFHPSYFTATTWLYNIESISKNYRVYCVDIIGDVGKSELTNLDFYPKNGKDYALWFSDILKKLNIDNCGIIGCSMGALISMYCAIYLPEQVNHLVLLNPIGLKAYPAGFVNRFVLMKTVPTAKKNRRLWSWVLGNDSPSNKYILDFLVVSLNCKQKMPAPRLLTKKELKKIKTKTLLLLGKKDLIIGSYLKAEKHAEKYIKALNVEIIDSGHIMYVERKDTVNTLILNFLNNN